LLKTVIPSYAYAGTEREADVGSQQYSPAALPRKSPGTQRTGGWVGLGAGLDGMENPAPLRDSILGPSSP